MDWRAIFVKYVEIVVRAEGVTFLYEPSQNPNPDPLEWTAEEWAAIQEAVE